MTNWVPQGAARIHDLPDGGSGRLAVISHYSLRPAGETLHAFWQLRRRHQTRPQGRRLVSICPAQPQSRRCRRRRTGPQPRSRSARLRVATRTALSLDDHLWPHEEVVLLPPQTEGQANSGLRNRVPTAAEIAEEEQSACWRNNKPKRLPQKAQRTAKAAKPRNRILTEGEPATTGARPTRTRCSTPQATRPQERAARRTEFDRPHCWDILCEFLTREGDPPHPTSSS